MMSFFERLFNRKPSPVEIQTNFIEKKSSRTATSRTTNKLNNGRVTCEDLPVLADASELRKIALIIIEVQSGSYVGEDDIVRFEDKYGRSKKT